MSPLTITELCLQPSLDLLTKTDNKGGVDVPGFLLRTFFLHPSRFGEMLVQCPWLWQMYMSSETTCDGQRKGVILWLIYKSVTFCSYFLAVIFVY